MRKRPVPARLNLLLLNSEKGGLIVFLQRRPARKQQAGRLRGRWGRLKDQVRRSYENLKERLDHHEKVCSELRRAQGLHIVHPPSWGQSEADGRLRRFLKLRYNYHGKWLWVNGILAALGILLTPVPGPNLFFFYPAARAFGHYHARQGAAAALGSAEWSFVAEPLLDRVQGRWGDLGQVESELAELEERYQVKRLAKHLDEVRGR
ncbi:MAG: hypothetical protein V3T83_06405 [Acidobacteriota bacterium]